VTDTAVTPVEYHEGPGDASNVAGVEVAVDERVRQPAGGDRRESAVESPNQGVQAPALGGGEPARRPVEHRGGCKRKGGSTKVGEPEIEEL